MKLISSLFPKRTFLFGKFCFNSTFLCGRLSFTFSFSYFSFFFLFKWIYSTKISLASNTLLSLVVYLAKAINYAFKWVHFCKVQALLRYRTMTLIWNGLRTKPPIICIYFYPCDVILLPLNSVQFELCKIFFLTESRATDDILRLTNDETSHFAAKGWPKHDSC